MALALRPFLLVAALARACWLRLLGRSGPDLGGHEGWPGRFRLAVWLALAMVPAASQEGLPPTVMCYDMAPPQSYPELPLARVRLMWMALDPAQGPALEAALAAAVRVGDVELPVSRLLVRVHQVLADHHDRTRVQRITCYRMTEAGARQMGHREAALAQLEALAKVRAAGQVAPEVLASAEAALRTELRQLGLEPAPGPKDAQAVARLLAGWYGD